MRKPLGILSLVSALMVLPETMVCQQPSIAFTQPLGIQSTPKTAVRDTTRQHVADQDHAHPSRGAFVVGGALVGGLAAGGWLGYQLYKGSRNNDDMMISPVVPLAVFAGCGMIVGGLIGLALYYGTHP